MSRKEISGIIVKVSGDKTYKVEVSYKRRHPLYKKIVSFKKAYLVHSENAHEVGEEVVITPINKKISKKKSFVIVENNNKVEAK